MLGQREHPGFDLSVAVLAEQDALAGFFAQRLDRAGQPAAAKAESLLRRIEVMEVQRARVAVEPAQEAGTARLVDEQALRAPAPLGDGIGATAKTLRRSGRSPREHGEPVRRAFRLEARLRTRSACAFRSCLGCRLEAVVPKPVPDCRIAAINSGCDVSHCQVLCDERLQLLACQRTTRSMIRSPFHDPNTSSHAGQ